VGTVIKDLEITSIEGKRFSQIDARQQEIRIDQNLSILDVRKEGEFQRVFYKFVSTFSGLGNISVEGSLLYSGTEDFELKWKKSKELPEGAASEVQGAIFTSSIVETITLARDLRLPPPVPMPNLQQQKKKDILGFG
jgi:hypothetical protein